MLGGTVATLMNELRAWSKPPITEKAACSAERADAFAA